SAPDNGVEQGDNQDTVSNPPFITRAAATSFNNITVYALAGKYDIQDLKDLATEKFRSRSDPYFWMQSDLFLALEVIYSNTPSGDRGLRDIISKLCAIRTDEFSENPRFRELMCKDGSMALDVLVHSRTIYKNDVKDLEELLTDVETEEKMLEAFITRGAMCTSCKSSSNLEVKTSQVQNKRFYILCTFCSVRHY
ncbi:MAG: hypothetical protein Q9207_008116, partial [Kuettlingeria erythrocarpa]